MIALTDDILASVRLERERQDKKWGSQNHVPVKFLAILSEEHGELAKEVVEFLAADSRDERGVRLSRMCNELIQVAAVAVAMVEAIERNRDFWAGPRESP